MRIENYTAQEIFDRLNDADEVSNIEAKALSRDSSRSIMETVCSFSNEPGLGGGVILLGAAENEDVSGARYVVEPVADLDKAQLDFATQCASMFNFPVRPEISVEDVDGVHVLRIFVPELPASRKPLYFKNDGIPRGIYRRIGSSDQRCGEDELPVFLRESGAVNNSVFRQLSGVDTLHASADLRAMRDLNVLASKGRGNATYYVPGEMFYNSTRAVGIETLQGNVETLQGNVETLQGSDGILQDRLQNLRNNPSIAEELAKITKHTRRETLKSVIVALCRIENLKVSELAVLVGKNETYLRTIILELVGPQGPLQYTIPDMPTHPNQAYRAHAE